MSGGYGSPEDHILACGDVEQWQIIDRQLWRDQTVMGELALGLMDHPGTMVDVGTHDAPVSTIGEEAVTLDQEVLQGSSDRFTRRSAGVVGGVE